MRGRTYLSVFLGILTGLSLLTALLAETIDAMGCSPGIMEYLMRRDAPGAYTGLDEREYPDMVSMITDYLSGKNPEFGYVSDGAQLFQAHEIRHMQDVRELFVLDRTVVLFSALVLAASTLSGLFLGRRRAWLGGVLAGFGALLILALVLIVWGMVDFPSLFIGFHELFFSNELWMLNPQTDLLIRLMPTQFFVHYALLIAVTFGILCAAASAAAVLCFRRSDRREK